MKNLPLALLVFALLSARPAAAQQPSGRIEAAFKLYDRDGDGAVTQAEAGGAAWFARADENGDRKLDIGEVRRKLGAFIERQANSEETAAAASDASLQEQPRILKAVEHGVGRIVPDLTLQDLSGRAVQLSAFRDHPALVIACVRSSCPLSKKFAPELSRLAQEYGAKNVPFLLLSPGTGDAAQLRDFVSGFASTTVIISDPQSAAAAALDAQTTTEVFVLDAARTLVYRGALNDQYGLGYSKEAPTRNYLRDALEAVLHGRPPTVAATTAPGCALDRPAAPIAAAPGAPTYHREISRIVQANCLECHRAGGIAPFALATPADLIEHAGMIKKQLERGAMPPWFAVPGAAGAHVTFANDRSLPESDKSALLAWLKSDRPLGDPAEAPLLRTFPEGWSIGQPDAVFQLAEPVVIKAEGTMAYQTRVVETSFAEERWVRGYEILPTAREVVHHVIVKVHAKGAAVVDRDEGNEGFFAAYVPGNSHRVLPDGFAKRLPAGAKLSFQIHYTPNGKATEDQLKIGLLFAAAPPQYEVHVAAVAQPRLNIPPGAANHVETKDQRVPANLNVTAFMAHMHVRGKAFKYELIGADGQSETLLDIPRYDFNWQLQYDYAQPKFIPRGSTLRITAVFDNSAQNPANPDPNKNVRWGPQTTDEMMIGYVEHFTTRAPAKVAAQ